MYFIVFDAGLENSLDGLLVKLVVLEITFFLGWGVGLVCIHRFGNLVYPLLMEIYVWACLVAIGILYIKVIQKQYNQKYEPCTFEHIC